MKILTLKRISETEDGTFGVLLDENNTPFCLTIELQWKDDKPEISCIPKGEYRVHKVNSPHLGNVFEVTNVPMRSEILIHKGNLSTDSKGCIILGESFGILNNEPAVLSSGMAFDELTRMMRNEVDFKLVIV